MKNLFILMLMLPLSFVAASAQSTPGEVSTTTRVIVEDIVLDGDFTQESDLLLASNLQLPETPSVGGADDEAPFDWEDWFFGLVAGLIPASIMEWFGTILIVGEIIVRATPTTTDDKWFLWVKRIIDSILPSRKKGGGSFPKADNTPI